VAAVGLVGARYNRLTGTTPKLRDDQLDGMVDVDVIGGNQLPLVSVAALRAVGAHDPELFYGFEELELGLRLRAAGFRLVVNGDQWLARRHAQGRAGPDAPRALRRETPSRRYLSVRNQLVVARRYGSVTAPLAVTAANLLARPVMDLRRGRRPWRRYQLSTARGLVDGWLGRLGPRADASATDAGATR
jgi:GT2 family glycosyltransferase